MLPYLTVGHVTLKGPNRLGAAELDEGALTARVVAQYAAEDGSGGQAAAEFVLPARRALWRLAEVYLPAQLAASLRARLARADQTGRDGVRELRAALADWLDPPPLCAACHRNIAAGTELVACPAKPQRTWSGRGRRPGPTTCAPARGPRALRGGAAVARDVFRCGTLALFTPLHLDPACAAAARLLRHGAAAYDLVVDRDARTLLEVTQIHGKTNGTVLIEPCEIDHDSPLPLNWVRGQVEPTPADRDVGPALVAAAGGMVPRVDAAIHAHHDVGSKVSVGVARPTQGESRVCTKVDGFHAHDISTPVAAARRHFDRVLDAAVRANGPLILKCQLRQYSPNGSATRADLVQGAAMGCRRALLDYDSKVARFSTYAIHWMRQGGGEAFAERDLVAVPDWAAGLRRAVEDRDLLPAQLLRLVGTVAETRPFPAHSTGHIALTPNSPTRSMVSTDECPGYSASHGNILARRRASLHAEAIDELGDYAGLHRAVVEPARKASKGVAAKPAKTVVAETTVRAVEAALLKAAAPPAKSKTDDDERARERVAAYVAARLGLRAGKKAVTGGALLTALRSGAAVVVGIGTGEHDDAGGDADGPGAGRAERLPEHLADESPDPEEAAAGEDEARRQMAALLAALEALRTADPEAAEVVRRRHAMDVLGDPETLEEIAAAPLRCTGRSRCREGVRQAYERGKAALKGAAPALLGSVVAVDLGDLAQDGATRRRVDVAKRERVADRRLPADHPMPKRASSHEVHDQADRLVPLKQSTRVIVSDSFICHDWHYSTSPTTAEDFGAWAAERDAMAAAF